MTPTARADLLNRHAEALSSYESAMQRAMSHKRYSDEERQALDEAERLIQGAMRIEEEYYRELPRLVLSRCPFDDIPLLRSFDPFGLDGLWWRPEATPEEPQPCRHFCVLTGALDFAGHPPRGGSFEAHVGPQAPFVIPRLLERPEMVAVLSRIHMENGYVAYPVAYFAERKPPPQDLTAGWARTIHLYRTQLGETEWQIPSERYDYDLAPWLDRAKLRWCVGETGAEWVLRTGAASCPYVDLPGEWLPRVVEGDRVWTEPGGDGRLALPTG